MNALIKWEWVSGISGRMGYVLSCRHCPIISGTYLGQTTSEAKQSMYEINEKRRELGLPVIKFTFA